jgi:hypothetical protein
VGKAGSVFKFVTVPDSGQVCQGQARPPWGHVCIHMAGLPSRRGLGAGLGQAKLRESELPRTKPLRSESVALAI